MKQEEIREILLSFDGATNRIDEENNLEIFEVDLDKLKSIWLEKPEDEMGDFEHEIKDKIINHAETAENKKPIFAIIHNNSSPLRFEVKTGVSLARILREKESVVPSKFMDEREWNKIIGFGQIPAEEAKDLFVLSYRMVTEEF